MFKTIAQSFLKLFFHYLYHSLAWSYDVIAFLISLGRWQTWVKSIERLLDDSPILEIGHGSGVLLFSLGVKNITAVGLDESRQMGKLTLKKLRKIKQKGQPISAQLVRAQAQAMPFTSAHFRCVAATFPTEYIFEIETLEQVFRILQPKGRLIVLLSAWIIGQSLPERAAAWIFRVSGESLPETPDIDSLLMPFVRAGFKAEAIWIDSIGSRLLAISARKPAFPPSETDHFDVKCAYGNSNCSGENK